MEFFKSKRQRQRETDSMILEVAGSAVADAVSRRADGESMPCRVDIPPTPKGLRPRDYLAGVQYAAGLALELNELDDEIACDEYASSLVNARAITGRPKTNLFTRHYHHQNPELVFKELKPLNTD